MFFLAIPLLFLAGYSEGFRSLPFRFLSTSRETKRNRIQKTISFLAYPSDYPKNETLGIEIAKQRMKEKMQKKTFSIFKTVFWKFVEKSQSFIDKSKPIRRPLGKLKLTYSYSESRFEYYVSRILGIISKYQLPYL